MTTPAKIIPTKMKHLTLLEQHLVCLFDVVTLLVVIVFVVVTCACSGADGVAAAGVDVIC